MIWCVTSDKSFVISGLDSLVPFTLVMILLRQSEHGTPVSFGGGGAAGADGSGGAVLDLSLPLRPACTAAREPWASPVFCIAAPRRKPMERKGKQTDGDAALHLPFPQRFAHANKTQEACRFAFKNE